MSEYINIDCDILRFVDMEGGSLDTMEISKEKDYSISIIRLITMIMIITCHILQKLDNEWAWWLNVGVQIFFIISGFLYGKKVILEPFKWIFRQFKKILLDYYIFIFILSIVYTITRTYHFTIINFFINMLGLQAFFDGLPNIGHLWFISYILICYIITPLLQIIFENLNNKSEISFWIFSIFLILVLQILEITKITSIIIPWISCYIFGYAISNRYTIERLNRNDKLTLKSITFYSSLICIILNGFKIYITYISKPEFKSSLNSEWLGYFFKYSHVSLGLTLFLVMFIVLNNLPQKYIKIKNTENILNYNDLYAFDIYIVHQIFILGKFSLIGSTDYLFLDIIIIILLTLISSFILRKISINIHILLLKVKYLQNK